MTSSGPGTRKSTASGAAWATHAALLLVQIAFASQAVEAKVAMMPRGQGGEEIFPEALAMIRMVGGALFFQGLVALRGPQEVAIRRSDHAKLVGLSFLGIAANQALFLFGLRWTTPFAVSLLGATIPVFAVVLAAVFGKERLALRTAIGVALAFAGVVTLTGIGSIDRGALLVALNCLFYAAYVVFSRDVVLRLGALRVVAWVFTYGAILFVPLGLGPIVASLPHVSARGAALLAYIVAVPTIVAYGLNAWALGRSSATLVTVYIYAQPLLTALLAWAQLGARVPLRAAVAGVLILAGLAVVASRQPARAAEPS